MDPFGRVAAALQIREGEGTLVGWLFAYAFFGGVPLTLTTAAANALFLEHHGAVMLPWAYLAAAAIVPAVGWVCLRIEHRASFDRFLFTVVTLILVGELAARASIAVLGPVRGTWALPVWTELEYSLTNLQLWALVGRLLNVQQAKRLLGVVGAGALLSGGVAGLLAPLFIRFIGTDNLLLLSATSTLASLLVLRRICVRERDRLAGVDEREGRRSRKKARTSTVASKPVSTTGARPAPIAAELRPYLRATYALMALSFGSYYVVERVFYDRAEARMPNAAQLASFLGIFFGITGLVSLVFRAWLSAQLLARWGLLVGLLALPVLIAIGAGSATATGATLGVGAATVFWAVAMTRAADRVLRESVDLQAALMLYQPLPKAQRVAVQGTAEGIVGPLAGGFAGGALILLDKIGVDVVRLTAILCALAILWVLVANHLRRAYRTVLERALADRRIKPEDVVYGESARATLLRALDSNWPGEVLYALDMLEEIGWRIHRTRASIDDRGVPILRKLLGHSSPDVRREALRRIERDALAELLPDVTDLVARDTDDRVRSRAYRVLAAVADDDEADRLWVATQQHEDPRVRREVMTGCLGSGSIDRIALAWAELRRLAEARDPASRILAAQVLRKVATKAFHRPLLKLLGDPNRQVRRAAIVACKTVRHPRLLPLVVGALRSRALRAPAAATLAAIGDPAIVLLRDFVHEERDWRVRVRALRIAARVKGPLAERLALDLLESSAEEVRHAALLALVACEHRPKKARALALGGKGDSGAKPAQVFEKLFQSEVTEATWTLGAIIDLDAALRSAGLSAPSSGLLPPSSTTPSSATPSSGQLPPSSAVPSSVTPSGALPLDPDGLVLVTRALRRELAAGRDRILLLLSFLYDERSIRAARANYASPSTDRRAIALELLDSALPPSVRAAVFPLFDDVGAKQALADMPIDTLDEDAGRQGRRGRLFDLVDPLRTNVTSWTRTCAMWALRDIEALRALESAPDEEVRATARHLLASNRGDLGDKHPMLTIEKVLILRSVPMFERTPDHILSELAGILKEVDLGEGAELIQEGGIGDCMFVIVKGAVKVHRGDEVLANLGSRDIVGEMSVLDPEPRSASVTTTAPTRLLRIDRDDFFDMMEDRIEIAQGILGVLCQRLRGIGSRSHSLHPPFSEV